jgi:hypothetical protein
MELNSPNWCRSTGPRQPADDRVLRLARHYLPENQRQHREQLSASS